MKQREVFRQLNNSVYTSSDSSARQLSAVPKHDDRVKSAPSKEQERDLRRENREYRATYRESENAFTMSIPYVVFLTIAVVAIVVMCIQYLLLDAKASDIKMSNSTLESEIDALRAENDAMEYDINSNIDIDYITKVAMEDLGMVYAKKGQIQYYDSSASEYMKQYKDVPGAD